MIFVNDDRYMEVGYLNPPHPLHQTMRHWSNALLNARPYLNRMANSLINHPPIVEPADDADADADADDADADADDADAVAGTHGFAVRFADSDDCAC